MKKSSLLRKSSRYPFLLSKREKVSSLSFTPVPRYLTEPFHAVHFPLSRAAFDPAFTLSSFFIVFNALWIFLRNFGNQCQDTVFFFARCVISP